MQEFWKLDSLLFHLGVSYSFSIIPVVLLLLAWICHDIELAVRLVNFVLRQLLRIHNGIPGRDFFTDHNSDLPQLQSSYPPGRLTWTMKMDTCKTILIYHPMAFRVHVNLQESNVTKSLQSQT